MINRENHSKDEIINALCVQACAISAGTDICFAVTNKRQVYCWGGGGVGKYGNADSCVNIKSVNKVKKKVNKHGGIQQGKGNSAVINGWLEPQLVVCLQGEEIVNVAVGSSHCLAVSQRYCTPPLKPLLNSKPVTQWGLLCLGRQ